MGRDDQPVSAPAPRDAAGPGASADELLPVVYDELHRLAGSFMRRERQNHTLSATALVHEAYEKLAAQKRVAWQGRSHFLAIGAQAMRRLLVNHAVGRKRIKRGGDRQRVTLDAAAAPAAAGELDLDTVLTLDRALKKLEALDPRQARVVELRYFAGMTTKETAEALGLGTRTVEREWDHARAWLSRELEG